MSEKIPFLFSIVCLTFYNSVGFASGFGYKPGELIVRFKPKANGKQRTIAERNAVLASIDGGTVKRCYRLVAGLTQVKLPSHLTVKNAIAAFQKEGEILYAEPNYYIRLLSTFPNDPRFNELWGMHNTGQVPPGGTPDADIDAPEAWDIETDASDIVVAAIDTGIAYDHPDLKGNIWINPGEDQEPRGVITPADWNGEDDDKNDYIDDVYGYDVVNDDSHPYDDGDPDDDYYGHGTHVSGTIGAVGNNGEGLVGVCWSGKMMALKSHNSDGSGTTMGHIIECIDYASDRGANVVNCSWGSYAYHQGLKDTIEAAGANGVLFVAAAGEQLEGQGWDNDEFPHYPSSYDLDNIISVLVTDENDDKPFWCDYGAISVDLGAPGTNILSCWPGGGYQWWEGTSMATPHVTGACALVWSVKSALTYLEVKYVVLASVDVIPELENHPELGRLCVTGGRLNLHSALLEAQGFPTDDAVVGWWKLDEGQGDIAHDSVGDNDGTLAEPPRDPAWLNDPGRGWCLDFDMDAGEEDYVSLSPIGALVTKSVTISAWINARSVGLGSGYHPILTQYEFEFPNKYNGYYFYVDNDKPAFYLNLHAAISEEAVVKDQWYHLAGTYDSDNLRIYVNGVLRGTQALEDNSGVHHNAYIGHDDVHGNSFDGLIDDVRVYNYALDIVEIWYVMSYGRSKFCVKDSSDEPVAWFDNLGNLFLKGNLEEGGGNDPAREYNDGFKFRNSNNQDAMIVDGTNGNMYIRQSEGVWPGPGPSEGVNEFIIESSTGTVAYITDSGYLYLSGELYEGN